MPVRRHILVVEDDADCREAVTDYLELQGYSTAMAKDGVEALELLGKLPQPDALLVDLKMPRMDGEALIAALRRDRRLSAIPVVAMTGAIERPCPEGAVALVHKPFTPDALLAAVACALGEAPLRRASAKG